MSSIIPINQLEETEENNRRTSQWFCFSAFETEGLWQKIKGLLTPLSYWWPLSTMKFREDEVITSQNYMIMWGYAFNWSSHATFQSDVTWTGAPQSLISNALFVEKEFSTTNPYCGIDHPYSRSARRFIWTQIDLVQSGEICAWTVMIHWTCIFSIRDFVSIEIAVTGVP